MQQFLQHHSNVVLFFQKWTSYHGRGIDLMFYKVSIFFVVLNRNENFLKKIGHFYRDNNSSPRLT